MNIVRPYLDKRRLFQAENIPRADNTLEFWIKKSCSRAFDNIQTSLIFLLQVFSLLAAPCNADQSARPPETSPRCSVRETPSGWWLIDPTGKPFFSLGVCEFNQGVDKHDANHPSYAGSEHYDSPQAWAAANVRRLHEWSFTTLGAWSNYQVAGHVGSPKLWMTPGLTMLQSGAPWLDLWDEKVIRQIDEIAKEFVTPLRGNPQVIGYYSDNELGWWNATLWKMALEQPATSGQRQQLIRVVRETYSDDWNALLEDFELENASSWEDLDRHGMLWLRPGGNGIRTMRRFLAVVAERYYTLMHDAIQMVDPGALYLGDRYQSFYYPAVAAAARKHVDCISTNLNANWNDGTILHSYLDTLHKLSDRPVLVSEFYMSAAENSSGNKNLRSGFPVVATQRERSQALTNTLRTVAALPYVVGAEWFQYYDEPPQGRSDGEDYNFGLVDIHDRPYEEVTDAFASTSPAAIKSAPSEQSANAIAGIPPAPADPLGQFKPMTALMAWDRQRGFVPASTGNPVGDCYVCWTPNALYVATYIIDVVEPVYYKDKAIPEADRALWNVQINEAKPITLRVGAGKDSFIDNPEVRVASISGTDHIVRCVTAIEIPASQLGKDRLSPNDRITLKSSFDTLGRADHIEWNGKFQLAK